MSNIDELVAQQQRDAEALAEHLCEDGFDIDELDVLDALACLGLALVPMDCVSTTENIPSLAYISARLRDLRREGLVVERKRVPKGNGLHVYRVLAPRGQLRLFA